MDAGTKRLGASEYLLAHKETLARAITATLYADDESLLERFGEAGRVKCLQDIHYCLEHLAPAVALHDPSVFARYVSWLEALLAARGIDSRDVRLSLEATRTELAGRLAPEESTNVLQCIQAGLDSLRDAPAGDG